MQNPLEIISFENIFIETDVAQGMNFRGRKTGNTDNFTMDVNPGYKFIEEYRGGVQWYMMESKDIIYSICFKLKNENNRIVSFNGQSITFCFSMKQF